MKFISTDAAARLEGISTAALLKRIERKKFPEWSIKRESRSSGGYCWVIAVDALSEHAQGLYLVQSDKEARELPTAEVTEERKRRADAGASKADEKIILICAAKVNNARVSFHGKINKSFGYKEVYESYFIPESRAQGAAVVSYRQFINLVKPFVDMEIQARVNLGPVRYKNNRQLVLRADYSVYEPMQMIQNDHTQFDCICVHNGRLLRPWAAMHISAGDRMRSYPTVSERPDSYSLADNLMNFVLRYGISDKEIIYKADNGKAQKSRLMTREGFKDVEVPACNLEEMHVRALAQMGIADPSSQGLVQNLGMIEGETTARLPRAKMIERSFGVGGTMEMFKDRPEYTGRKYEEKPERLAKVIKSGQVWHSDEMIDYVMDYVDRLNNRRHAGIEKECNGRYAIPHLLAPSLEYFQTNARVLDAFKGVVVSDMGEVVRIFNDAEFARDLGTELYSPMWRRRIWELCGWQSRQLPSKESLAMMILPHEERTVHPYGISINSHYYISRALQPFVTKKVVCRYSPSNILRIREQSGKEILYIQEIYVFAKIQKAGKWVEEFICIAEPHPSTVIGVKPSGYAKAFISGRSRDYREISSAAKIVGKLSGEREAESVVTGAKVIELNSFRETAARKMDEAIKVREEQEKVKEIVTAELAEKASAIYGQTVNIEE